MQAVCDSKVDLKCSSIWNLCALAIVLVKTCDAFNSNEGKRSLVLSSEESTAKKSTRLRMKLVLTYYKFKQLLLLGAGVLAF